MELHPSGEDYLKAIFLLKQRQGAVRSVDLAHYMGYSKASISRAVSLLKNGGLLQLDPQGFFLFTKAGRRKAAHLYEKYCTIATLLIQIGVNTKTAHSDACRIEHSISEEAFQRLKLWVKGCS